MYIGLTAIFVFLLDRITKLWIVEHFQIHETKEIVEGLFQLTYILNKGAAFGILEDQRWFLLAIVIALLVALFVFRKKISTFSWWAKMGIGLLLGGAIGNAYDRFSQGTVIDFLDFLIWPIFNIADIGITVGVALVIFYLWKSEEHQ